MPAASTAETHLPRALSGSTGQAIGLSVSLSRITLRGGEAVLAQLQEAIEAAVCARLQASVLYREQRLRAVRDHCTDLGALLLPLKRVGDAEAVGSIRRELQELLDVLNQRDL